MQFSFFANGKFKALGFFGWFLYAIIYWLITALIFVNLHFADLAQINVGIINGIWNILPLFMSVLDFFFYKEKLACHNLVGVFTLVTSALLITVAGYNDGEVVGIQHKPVL